MKANSRPPEDYLQNNRETIGKQIRTLREEKGLSQDDLAEIMDVQHSTISKVETGKFAITIDYLVKFGWYLDFDIAVVKKIEKY